MASIKPAWEQVEGQEGLYLESYNRMNLITGKKMLCRFLHSSEGYCFYDKSDKHYDEEGNELSESEVKPEDRTYYQYMPIVESTDISNFVSVKIDESFEMVNRAI